MLERDSEGNLIKPDIITPEIEAEPTNPIAAGLFKLKKNKVGIFSDKLNKDLESNTDLKPAPKFEENATIEDPEIKKHMDRFRKANSEQMDLPDIEETINEESPISKVEQANINFDSFYNSSSNFLNEPKINPIVEFSREINPDEEKPIVNEEYQKSYDVINFGKKGRVRSTRSKDESIFNNDQSSSNISDSGNSTMSFEDLIKLNKNKPIPKARIIDDSQTYTVTTTNFENSEHQNKIQDLYKASENLTNDYLSNKKEFIQKASKGFVHNPEKLGTELTEGTTFFDSKSKGYFKFENGKFKLDRYEGDFSYDVLQTVNTKIEKIDLSRLLKENSDEYGFVKPSDLRKRDDILDFENSSFTD